MNEDKTFNVRKLALDYWCRHATNGFYVDLESIKNEIGVSKNLKYNNYFNSSAFITPVEDGYEVSINKDIFYASSKWRSDLAHEIGHAVLWQNNILSESLIETDAEPLCDLFAEELLLPSPILTEKLKASKWTQLDIVEQLHLVLKIARLSYCVDYLILKKIIRDLKLWHCVVISCERLLENDKVVWRQKWGIAPPDTKGIFLPWVHNKKRVYPRIKGRLYTVLNSIQPSDSDTTISIEDLDYGGIKKFLLDKCGYSTTDKIKIAIKSKETTAPLLDCTTHVQKLMLCIPLVNKHPTSNKLA